MSDCYRLTEVELAAMEALGYSVVSGPHDTFAECFAECASPPEGYAYLSDFVTNENQSCPAVVDTGLTTLTMQSAWWASSGAAVGGMMPRYVDQDNWINVQWNTLNNEWRFIKRIAGVTTVLTTDAATISTDSANPTTMRVEVAGDDFALYVDESFMNSVNVSDLTGNTVQGLSFYRTAANFPGFGNCNYYVVNPTAIVLFDGFSHDTGSNLHGTSFEAGTGLPATWNCPANGTPKIANV